MSFFGLMLTAVDLDIACCKEPHRFDAGRQFIVCLRRMLKGKLRILTDLSQSWLLGPRRIRIKPQIRHSIRSESIVQRATFQGNGKSTIDLRSHLFVQLPLTNHSTSWLMSFPTTWVRSLHRRRSTIANLTLSTSNLTSTRLARSTTTIKPASRIAGKATTSSLCRI